MDAGLERMIAAVLAEARHRARRVRSARHHGRLDHVTREGDAMPDETTTEPTPARPDVMRDRMLERAAEAIDSLEQPSDYAEIQIEQRIATMAEAAEAFDRMHHAAESRAALATPPPTINVERLCADVWHATQAAGYPTVVGDAAVEAIRKVLS